MNLKTTLLLVAVAVGLFGYIHFVELRTGNSAERQQQAARLFPNFDPAKVTSIEISRSNETVRAELRNGEWRLTTPPYPAQETAIESFLRALSLLTQQSEIPAQEIISSAGGLSPFGLDPASASIKIQEGTNLIQLRVGARTLLGDRVYVQPAGASGICATDAALLQNLPASGQQWRDSMLLHAGNLAFDRIALAAGSRPPLRLERDRTNLLWRLAEPMPARADFNRVELGLLQQLRSARVSQFITDDPKADLEPLGLQPPEAELTLAIGTNPVFQVQFGKSPTNDASLVYARCLNHTNVVLISRDLADLVQKGIDFFRDRTLVTFPPPLVDRIEGHAAESFSVQRQAGGRWRIVEPFQAPADQQLMELFLKGLAGLEVLEFGKDVETDFSGYGLARPQRSYSLSTAVTDSAGVTHQPLLQIDFGNNVATNEFGKVYCRRSDESSVYVVSFADMLRLPRAAFELRDRHVWSFASSNATGVTIWQRGQKWELRRDEASGAWVKNDQVASAAIEETLHRLGEFQADSWAEIGEHHAKLLGTTGSKHRIALDLTEAGKPRRLELAFGNLATSGQPYAAVTLEQGQPVIFKFPAQLYALIVEHLSIPPAAAP